jgi:hypothetical protein
MRLLVTRPLLEGVKPQDISNTLWACARLRINPGDAALNSLLQAMARPAMLEAAAPQSIGNVLWAASQLREDGVWQPQVQQRVWQCLLAEEQLKRLADRSRPNELSNIMLGLGRLAAPTPATAAAPAISPEFAQQCAVQLLQGRVAQDPGSWGSQQIANTMWACAKVKLFDVGFFDRAAAARSQWLPTATRAELQQVAWACMMLQVKHQQLMEGTLKRIKQIADQQWLRATQQGVSRDTLGVIMGVCHAVAALDMQQLAGDARRLIAESGVTHSTNIGRLANLLWEVHTWLVQHQLLDGQGLAGLLSQQQLDEGRACSETYWAQQRQQQQM